jgi:hypothetical protein
MTSFEVFQEYLLHLSDHHLSPADILDIGIQFTGFLQSGWKSHQFLQTTSLVRLVSWTKQTLTDAACSDVLQAWETVVTLFGGLPGQGKSIIITTGGRTANATGAFQFRVTPTDTGGYSVQVPQRQINRFSSLPGLLSGPPTVPDSVVDHVPFIAAVAEHSSGRILDNPYTGAAALGRPLSVPSAPSPRSIVALDNSPFSGTAL